MIVVKKPNNLIWMNLIDKLKFKFKRVKITKSASEALENKIKFLRRDYLRTWSLQRLWFKRENNRNRKKRCERMLNIQNASMRRKVLARPKNTNLYHQPKQDPNSSHSLQKTNSNLDCQTSRIQVSIVPILEVRMLVQSLYQQPNLREETWNIEEAIWEKQNLKSIQWIQ